MSRLLWHGLGLLFKLSYTRNSLVLDEIRRILVHQRHNQTGVVNQPKMSHFSSPVSQRSSLQHGRTSTTGTPDRLDPSMAALGWFRAISEAILYPKWSRGSTRYAVSWCTGRIFEPVSILNLFTTSVSQIPFFRHHGTFTTLTPDRLAAVTASLARFGATNQTVIYPKRSSTRRDTPYPGAPAA